MPVKSRLDVELNIGILIITARRGTGRRSANQHETPIRGCASGTSVRLSTICMRADQSFAPTVWRTLNRPHRSGARRTPLQAQSDVPTKWQVGSTSGLQQCYKPYQNSHRIAPAGVVRGKPVDVERVS